MALFVFCCFLSSVTLQLAIATLELNVTEIADEVSANSLLISDNADAIDENTGAIDDLEARVNANNASIIQNAADIASNDDDISGLQGAVSSISNQVCVCGCLCVRMLVCVDSCAWMLVRGRGLYDDGDAAPTEVRCYLRNPGDEAVEISLCCLCVVEFYR